MNRKFSLAALLLCMLVLASAVQAQRTEISIGLSEQFFDTVIDALFQSGEPPEFSIAGTEANDAKFVPASLNLKAANCRESIRLKRESGGVRTAVRFRGGKILAPLAFHGSYNPPFVGCVDFSGWAETSIDLSFDEANQQLVARASVLNVSLDGTGGVGGNVIARMVQTAIDRKINPIEILKLDKISFMLPVQGSSNLSMKAVGVRHELRDGAMNVYIAYELTKR
jgi:hypothetical protein